MGCIGLGGGCECKGIIYGIIRSRVSGSGALGICCVAVIVSASRFDGIKRLTCAINCTSLRLYAIRGSIFLSCFLRRGHLLLFVDTLRMLSF